MILLLQIRMGAGTDKFTYVAPRSNQDSCLEKKENLKKRMCDPFDEANACGDATRSSGFYMCRFSGSNQSTGRSTYRYYDTTYHSVRKRAIVVRARRRN